MSVHRSLCVLPDWGWIVRKLLFFCACGLLFWLLAWDADGCLFRRRAAVRQTPMYVNPSVGCPTCPSAIGCQPENDRQVTAACPMPFTEALPVSQMANTPALQRPFKLMREEQPSPQQDTVLEPRPGTGLPLKPGKEIRPEILLPLPSQVTIGLHPNLTTGERLSSLASKLDTLLSLGSVVLTIFGAGAAWPWVARVASGLHAVLQVLSAGIAARSPGPVPPSGPPAPSTTVNPVVPSST